MSVYADKPIFVISEYGATGYYLNKSHSLKKHQNLNIVSSLPEAVKKLQDMK